MIFSTKLKSLLIACFTSGKVDLLLLSFLKYLNPDHSSYTINTFGGSQILTNDELGEGQHGQQERLLIERLIQEHSSDLIKRLLDYKKSGQFNVELMCLFFKFLEGISSSKNKNYYVYELMIDSIDTLTISNSKWFKFYKSSHLPIIETMNKIPAIEDKTNYYEEEDLIKILQSEEKQEKNISLYYSNPDFCFENCLMSLLNFLIIPCKRMENNVHTRLMTQETYQSCVMDLIMPFIKISIFYSFEGRTGVRGHQKINSHAVKIIQLVGSSIHGSIGLSRILRITIRFIYVKLVNLPKIKFPKTDFLWYSIFFLACMNLYSKKYNNNDLGEDSEDQIPHKKISKSEKFLSKKKSENDEYQEISRFSKMLQSCIKHKKWKISVEVM